VATETDRGDRVNEAVRSIGTPGDLGAFLKEISLGSRGRSVSDTPGTVIQTDVSERIVLSGIVSPTPRGT